MMSKINLEPLEKNQSITGTPKVTSNESKCYYRSQLLTVNKSINPLIAAAASIFALAIQLEKASYHGHKNTLLQQLIHEIKAFEHKAQLQGYRPKTINSATYAIACLLDEIIQKSNWGISNEWKFETLLHLVKQDVDQDNNFFTILEKILKEPTENLELLELNYLCLALGYEGKHHYKNKVHDLPNLIDQLYAAIRKQRTKVNKCLLVRTEHTTSTPNQKSSKIKWWQLLLFIIISASLANALMYINFSLKLNAMTKPIFVTAKKYSEPKNTIGNKT